MTSNHVDTPRLLPHSIPFLTRIGTLLAAGQKIDRKEELLAHQRDIIKSLQAELENERLNHAILYREVRKAHKGISRRNNKIAAMKEGIRKLKEIKQVLIGEKILVQEKEGEGAFRVASPLVSGSDTLRAAVEISKIVV